MRKLFVRIIVSLALLTMSAECSGSGSGSGQFPTTVSPSQPSAMSWSAAVAQPVTPIVVAPGQTIIIIIDLVPINGVVFSSPVFFNLFTSANPNLIFSCPSLLTVGSPIIGPVTVGGVPSVVFSIAPTAFGSCVIPINGGFAGIIPLSVQISGSTAQSTSQRRYVVRLTTGAPAPKH